MAATKGRRVRLREFAFARSGDKGDGSNVGLFVRTAADYELIRRQVTAAAVKKHFRAICFGVVTRYEAPNMLALNFLLRDSLGGGGSESLKTDAQGKTHGLALLEMEVVRPAPARVPQTRRAPAARRGKKSRR
jgi:hypothetical protein